MTTRLSASRKKVSAADKLNARERSASGLRSRTFVIRRPARRFRAVTDEPLCEQTIAEDLFLRCKMPILTRAVAKRRWLCGETQRSIFICPVIMAYNYYRLISA